MLLFRSAECGIKRKYYQGELKPMITQENSVTSNNDMASTSSGASAEDRSVPKNFDDVFILSTASS